MIRTSITSRQIYECLYQACPEYVLPGPWLSIPADANVRGIPANPSGLLAQLQQSFGVNELVRSGVARQTADGTLVPADVLTLAGPFIFLRSEPEHLPIEVLTPGGSLSGRHLPVVAALSDFYTRQALLGGEQRGFLVAFTTADVAVLRALGCAATLATGLEAFDRKQLGHLSRCFGWHPGLQWDRLIEDHLAAGAGGTAEASAAPEGASEATTPTGAGANVGGKQGGASSLDSQVPTSAKAGQGKPRPSLPELLQIREAIAARMAQQEQVRDTPQCPGFTLLAWSPALLLVQKPAVLDAILKHLRSIQNHLDWEDMDVGLWLRQPYLEKLHYQLQYAPHTVSAADLLNELDEHCSDAMFAARPAPVATTPTNFSEAVQEYRAALHAPHGNSGQERLTRAAQYYLEFMEKELIQPLFRPGASPVVRNLQANLMTHSRLLLELGPGMEADLAQRSNEPIPQGQVNQLCQLTRNLIALARELRR